MNPRAHRHTKKRSVLSMALRIAASVVILALLLHFLPFEQLRAAVGRIPLALWLVVLAGYLCAHVIGLVKWRLMLNLAGAGLSFGQAARCYGGGLFGTLFLPSIVGGDVVRLGLALRLAHHRAGAVLGSVFDRVLDFAALAIVAASGALFLPGALDPRSRRIFFLLGVLAVLGAVVVVAVVALLPARRFSHRIRRRLVRLRQAARAMRRRPQFVVVALGLGVTVQTSFVLLTAAIAVGCGLHVPIRVWLFVWPLAKLSALLPVTQGGIGVREVALAALAAPFGVAPVLMVAVGLVWEAIIVAGGLLAGLLSLLLGRFAASPAPTPPGPAAATSGEIASARVEQELTLHRPSSRV